MMLIGQALAADICAELATSCHFVPFEVCGEAPQTANSMYQTVEHVLSPCKSYAGLADSFIVYNDVMVDV